MNITKINTINLENTTIQWKSQKELREKMGTILVDTLQKMVADSEFRLGNCAKDPSLLGMGIFYPNDYAEQLNNDLMVDRIELLAKASLEEARNLLAKWC